MIRIPARFVAGALMMFVLNACGGASSPTPTSSDVVPAKTTLKLQAGQTVQVAETAEPDAVLPARRVQYVTLLPSGLAPGDRGLAPGHDALVHPVSDLPVDPETTVVDVFPVGAK